MIKLGKGCYLWMQRYLKIRGYHSSAAAMIAQTFLQELFQNPYRFTLRQRIWAWKRGFFAERIKMYNLSEENYRDFLSDADYMRLYPLNNQNRHWVDDKLTLRYVLAPFRQLLPAYFFSIRKTGEFIPMMDWPEDVEAVDFESFFNLLMSVGVIAAKPATGSVGEGFYRLSYSNGIFFANETAMDKTEISNFVRSLKGYIFTEYIRQSDLFEDIYPGIAHTVRIQTARMPDDGIQCILSFIRFGGSKLISCVTHSTLGLTASVDPETGKITHPYYTNEKGAYIATSTHPDTGKPVCIQIPRWEEITSKCIEIHKYLGELDYLGFDVITTNDGFKICEINSFSSIRSAQHGYPVWKYEKTRTFFSWKLGR